MDVLLLGAVVLVVVVGFLAIALLSSSFGQNTCRECGAGQSSGRLAKQAVAPAVGDWACPKCGARFDPHGRARDQMPR